MRGYSPNMVLMVIVILLSVIGCSKGDLTETIPPTINPTDTTVANMNNTANQTVLVQLVNAVRAKGCNCGDLYMPPVAPIKWNRTLEKVAWIKSKDMLDNNYFAHRSPDGIEADDIINRMGYKWHMYGENLAVGTLNEEQLVQSWLNSPSHCMTIMNPAYTEMGVAQANYFWSQIMAEPQANNTAR
ncbi:Cysteine-rich secretory protein family protein [Chitinophaga skermanii]|uniref:Cysteine-rich secretory protein family protein n=1 Tax=Chitinophaga skermanii TaxID=331697 RepID=A0A327QB26_9BACT|nr:CAP domain-containing protein [Chitinophaga skermanii]RAJ01491.1 Cysteine-rich secretory protein family protein [Chitinophaga skermanii]